MTVHLQREIDKLKQMILKLGGVVEDSLRRSVQAIAQMNPELAGDVVRHDVEIDRMEIDVEEECLKTLALHQPVAIDLRFIIAVLKINNDLERIGDLAANIAERAAFVCRYKPADMPFDFSTMAQKTQTMLRDSLNALVRLDPALAARVCAADQEVDEMCRDMYSRAEQAMRDHPQYIEALIHLHGVSRQLERIADHATNIAEDVIYMIEGRIVRHGL